MQILTSEKYIYHRVGNKSYYSRVGYIGKIKWAQGENFEFVRMGFWKTLNRFSPIFIYSGIFSYH